MAALGDVYSAVNTLKTEAEALFAAYENDDDVEDMRVKTQSIVDKSVNLRDALAGINEALGEL